MTPSTKLIIALDFDTVSSALTLVDQLDPNQCALKVGSELFTLLGMDFVHALISRQFKVFLDLKFHDIQNTVARACAIAADAGVWMLTLHASGGFDMMHAARKKMEPFSDTRPLLVAVTALTSMRPTDLQACGVDVSLPAYVGLLARLAQEAGVDGVVSSALEVPMIKAACGQTFLAVTPGIRRLSDTNDDQKRIVTPEMALNAGSDYLVVGRPITRAMDPARKVAEFLAITSCF